MLVRSMTGFGRGEAGGDLGRIIVEMKAVNHRFSEVVFRMPRQFAALEEPARKLVQGRVSRGRVDVFVSWEAAAKARGVKVDKELAIAYYNALMELGGEIGSKSELSLDTLARLPDVLKVEEGEVTAEDLWPSFEAAVAAAVDSLIAMREREGANLKQDLLVRADHIEELGRAVAQRAPQVVDEYRGRLAKRLEDLLGQSGVIDPQRLAQEVAIFADRSDITEEIQRLSSHLSQFRSALGGGDAVGRKLDFLVQEIGREINTIGSKANDATITNHVVACKSELEKIREQVQNIE
ncbi:MAG TPA: YicC/YloC family endoribonuclease [Symbiobacteriaceae bacterium]|nr:YicC/YloC family endoribonuclease [Symbiobacteriaceae bacterium]